MQSMVLSVVLRGIQAEAGAVASELDQNPLQERCISKHTFNDLMTQLSLVQSNLEVATCSLCFTIFLCCWFYLSVLLFLCHWL